jgi:hypothetical protein
MIYWQPTRMPKSYSYHKAVRHAKESKILLYTGDFHSKVATNEQFMIEWQHN